MTERVDVDVDGGRLATFRLGALGDVAGGAPAEAVGGAHGTGAPPVLAIHGITSTSRSWVAVARALEGRAELLAVDLRGRGDSSSLPRPFGLDAHVRDLVAVLDRFGLERAVVTGHSLGAYIAARLATAHPERVERLVLVDGGLTIPGTEDVDPDEFMQAFLGPALARLQLTFADLDAYVDWWLTHPAFAAADIDPGDLRDYARHDLAGQPPEQRSAVNPDVVGVDGRELFGVTDANRLTQPAVLLCAPRGMVDDPNPMQPLAVVQAWAAAAPDQRRAVQVPGVNHYSIVLGARGAQAVADAIAG